MAFTSAFLLLLTAVLLTCVGYTTSATVCSNCGTTRVPYPLSTGPNCGDPAYKIRCDAGTLRFDTLNNTYAITSVSPENQRLVIRPAEFINNNRTCVTTDLPTEGVQLNTSLPFNVTSSNTILYLNCTNLLLGSPLNCTSTSLCHSYINGSAEASACGNSNLCCTFRAGGSTNSYSIRLRDSACRAYRSFVNLDYSLPVSRWPAPGLELQWVSPPEPLCGTQADCDSESTCGAAENGLRRCFCNSGLHWDPVAGLCAAGEFAQSPFCFFSFSTYFLLQFTCCIYSTHKKESTIISVFPKKEISYFWMRV